MKKILSATLAILLVVLFSCTHKKNPMEEKLKQFIAHYDSVYIPVYKDVNIAYWNASITGNDADYAKLEESQKKIVEIFSNKDDFNTLKSIKESGGVEDSLLIREMKILYNFYIPYQSDTSLINRIVSIETRINKAFSTFRADVKGKKVTDNEIESILSKSVNNKELETAWSAHKQVGKVVETDLLTLVKLRNEVAQKMGFENYHQMSLSLLEQDPVQIEKLFDELDSLTSDAFITLKSEIDSFLAQRCKIRIDQLMPWHYQNRFFQEAPKIYNVDLDKYYADKGLDTLTSNYYRGLGILVDEIMANSDLYEKPGKNQHAYCTDIDKKGDVRVLCNIKPDNNWMGTMLHEFGHAAYFKYIDNTLPFVLRDPAHIFTTEAIAMLFGRMSSNPQWIQDMIGISDSEKTSIAEDAFKSLRLQQLVFSRWSQVMYRFEKSLYENPDADLNSLWWQLVEKYQFVKKPEGRNEPDWASKIHIASSPCYYHNYLLGEMLASQLNHYIAYNVYRTRDVNNISYCNNEVVGKYLIDNVFAPGNKYFWDIMIEKATGEKLTPKYYAEQFVQQ